ncbi:hypothetical protein HaLaN_29135, partial [Haematococcus lacustris]
MFATGPYLGPKRSHHALLATVQPELGVGPARLRDLGPHGVVRRQDCVGELPVRGQRAGLADDPRQGCELRLHLGQPCLGRLGLPRDATVAIVLPGCKRPLPHGHHCAGSAALLVRHSGHVCLARVHAQPLRVEVGQRVDCAHVPAHPRQLCGWSSWLGPQEHHAEGDSIGVHDLIESVLGAGELLAAR